MDYMQARGGLQGRLRSALASCRLRGGARSGCAETGQHAERLRLLVFTVQLAVAEAVVSGSQTSPLFYRIPQWDQRR